MNIPLLFQFYIVKENRGNEGTCVGVSRWPVHDFNHRTTSDMWLYRAYSGNLYHNGEQTLTLSSFTQGDFITCVLDMEARTISFGKNGEVPTPICKHYIFLVSIYSQLGYLSAIYSIYRLSTHLSFLSNTFWFLKYLLTINRRQLNANKIFQTDEHIMITYYMQNFLGQQG